MKRGTKIGLKVTILSIGFIILALSIFMLPNLATYTVEMNPEYAYLRLPVLIGLYITAVPFFLALYQAIQLINYIESENAFSNLAVESLRNNQLCLGIIASGIGFVLAQRTPLRFRDIRRRL